ncbi:MAG TPA: 23S rRNA (uracil(1939)-C(5))-methyltransferase RlmD [Acidobacteriaceae bacterium]|jgi:23S rRNA (uracil1939-C5)-methyltransferase|nr:23S rRNA (uracil(1939)-C(5))-methyltransferase RlmD [Acidobacteriaceae bacterium]
MKLRIEKAIYGGAGLARVEGKAVFVPFALPGELVEAAIAEENKSYATAELVEVLEPSADRHAAPCPYFGRCGGCHYQHADYAAQVEMKRAILRETLERARVGGIPEIEAVTGEPFGYRNRVRLHVEKNPFHLCYKKRNSHVNLPVEVCPIAAPVLGGALGTLNREGEGLGLGAWVQEVELFTDQEQAAMLVALWTEKTKDEAAPLLGSCWGQLQKTLPRVVGAGVFSAERGAMTGKLLAQAGEGALTYRAGARSYRVGLGSFFQVNRFLVDGLVDLVTSGEAGGLAWDLYAGAGLFSLALTETFHEVVAVETGGAAVRDLRENLRGTHAREARHRVVSAETAGFLRQAIAQKRPAPELVVVDPPRAGLGREVTALLGKVRARNVTYVSCDPATLSRDVVALLESGYRLAKMHLVDLFPQTFHLESVAHLTLD